jgi:anthranilate synthase component 1
MIHPTLAELHELAKMKQGNLTPIYREVVADLETPVSAFLKIRKGDYSFLLESVEGGEQIARYSFLGTAPFKVLVTDQDSDDPLIALEEELDKIKYIPHSGLPPFTGGAIGYVGYEAVHHYEPRVPVNDTDPIGIPESMFLLCETIVVFDHLRHRMQVVAHCKLDKDIDEEYAKATERIETIVSRLKQPIQLPKETPDAEHNKVTRSISNVGKEGYELMVEAIREQVIAGEVIQAVPSQRLTRPINVHPFTIYRQLRTVNPSPYMFYLEMGDFQIVGASPELLVRVENGLVTTHPIAGTRPRGKTPAEDEALANELLADEKERAEHIMLVDLGRNDVGKVSQAGTVNVDSLMKIERYSHVMHIVSQVSGRLRSGLSRFDAFRSIFPAGTVTGAPKVRAMEIIAELEEEKRGIYAGAVGYASFAGTLDTCIAIRTMVTKNKNAYIQAGAGIVYDSIPSNEYQESMNKLGALERALDQAETSLTEDTDTA